MGSELRESGLGRMGACFSIGMKFLASVFTFNFLYPKRNPALNVPLRLTVLDSKGFVFKAIVKVVWLRGTYEDLDKYRTLCVAEHAVGALFPTLYLFNSPTRKLTCNF